VPVSSLANRSLTRMPFLHSPTHALVVESTLPCSQPPSVNLLLDSVTRAVSLSVHGAVLMARPSMHGQQHALRRLNDSSTSATGMNALVLSASQGKNGNDSLSDTVVVGSAMSVSSE